MYSLVSGLGCFFEGLLDDAVVEVEDPPPPYKFHGAVLAQFSVAALDSPTSSPLHAQLRSLALKALKRHSSAKGFLEYEVMEAAMLEEPLLMGEGKLDAATVMAGSGGLAWHFTHDDPNTTPLVQPLNAFIAHWQH